MAYDEHLAERVRQYLPAEGVVGKQMFGGIAFLYRGNMSVGVIGDDLCVRLSKEEGERALAEPHVRPMDFTGKPMQGWLYVAPGGTERDEDLRRWVERGVAFAASLPAKA